MEVETTVAMSLTLEQYNKLQSERNRDFWVNVYPSGHFVIWPTKEIAEEHYQTGRVALVHLKMENGQFVPCGFMDDCYSHSSG
jgi:hypothetical protein